MSLGNRRHIKQSPLFGRKVKKFKSEEKAALDQEIRKVFSSPELGHEKRGDLRGVRIHKYRFQQQEMLLAYSFNDYEILLINIGPHENYYRDLKHYLA